MLTGVEALFATIDEMSVNDPVSIYLNVFNDSATCLTGTMYKIQIQQ